MNNKFKLLIVSMGLVFGYCNHVNAENVINIIAEINKLLASPIMGNSHENIRLAGCIRNNISKIIDDPNVDINKVKNLMITNANLLGDQGINEREIAEKIIAAIKKL